MTDLQQTINKMWDESIVPTLMEYIKIPNKSPHFDPRWQENGYMQAATNLIANWCKTHALPQMNLEIVQLENRTPIILIEIPGKSADTVLLYGHLDKQPEMTGWESGLSPWQPVLRGDKLYGRGAADDGYAAFASLSAIYAMQKANLPHARCVILIEACEESGSYDLPFYIDALRDRIGKPNLVVCLDSGCGNYEQMWVTTSLRGLISATLSINVLTEGIHSGSGSGVVPSCFRILRQMLNRIEDINTGNIILSDLHVSIPPIRHKQANAAAAVLGDTFYSEFPILPGLQLESAEVAELLLRRTWLPALSVIGCDGMPNIENAGNVTLPQLSVKLSLRVPPTCNVDEAAEILNKTMNKNPPNHAQIKFTIQDTGPGWNAPEEAPWLAQAASEASQRYFGKDAMYMGEGGSIPFMGMLGKKFPEAQFLITGVLGPHSNAHGPNEFLHIPTGKKLTACIAHVIHAQFLKNS